MIAFKHNANLPRRKFDRYSGSRAAWLMMLCCCLGLCAPSLPCWAKSSSNSADNQTIQIKFISLNPTNTISTSTVHLHADGTLDFSIEGETLINTGGTWSVQTNRFSAAVDFTIDKQTPFHYLLKFEGYCLMGLYAGRARLCEYDRHERLTQEIWFLFYALPPDYKRSGIFPKKLNNY
jgi:hypothetical protein